MALTLRSVGGLTVPEIARAFLSSESAMERRLASRARRKVTDAPHPLPRPTRRAARRAPGRRAARRSTSSTPRATPPRAARCRCAATCARRRSASPGCSRSSCPTRPRRSGCSRCCCSPTRGDRARVGRGRRPRRARAIRTARAGTPAGSPTAVAVARPRAAAAAPGPVRHPGGDRRAARAGAGLRQRPTGRRSPALYAELERARPVAGRGGQPRRRGRPRRTARAPAWRSSKRPRTTRGSTRYQPAARRARRAAAPRRRRRGRRRGLRARDRAHVQRGPARGAAALASADAAPRASWPLRVVYRWAGVDSNHRATDYESAALTTELPARIWHYSTQSTPQSRIVADRCATRDRPPRTATNRSEDDKCGQNRGQRGSPVDGRQRTASPAGAVGGALRRRRSGARPGCPPSGCGSSLT